MKVIVKTPARLHLGLIDMNGDLGRMFGGIGVGINHPSVVVEAKTAENFSVIGQETELARTIVRLFLETYNLPTKVHINVVNAIPRHIGLGSGTQLSLAIAVCLAKLYAVKASIPELATTMGRAKRTSVGTNIFLKGGFVVDGGKNLKNPASFPPLLFRQPFPNEWRFIVAIPSTKKGLSNSAEKKAFNKLTTMPTEDIGQICRLTMLKLLPALAERDIENFGDALTKIQVLTGNYFSQAQGGTYASIDIAKIIEFMKQSGAYGVGQSSWGPALYAIVKKEQAKPMLKKIRGYLLDGVGGKAFIAKANNRGATIRTTED